MVILIGYDKSLLGGFINCDATFTDHPAILNGASDLMGEIFAKRGLHARFAVGVSSCRWMLPLKLKRSLLLIKNML